MKLRLQKKIIYFNHFQILKKLRALPVGKLQSSFNIAGSWADMVTCSFCCFFWFFCVVAKLQTRGDFDFAGSLSLETNGRLMVFKSFPAKEPKVGVCSIQVSLSTKLWRLQFDLGKPSGRTRMASLIISLTCKN